MTVEAAAAMGFARDDAEQAMRVLESLARPDDLSVTMDLARFCLIPLPDAAMALATPRRLRRLGFASEADMRTTCAGFAEAYTHTFYGSLDVREAQGNTISRALLDAIERTFGRR